MTQRQIKFRAWDGGKLLSEEQIAFVPGIATNHPMRFGEALRLLEKKYLLEQFTGLLDKNGNEIYEGDILGYPNKSVKEVVKFGAFNNQREYEDNDNGVGWYRDGAFGVRSFYAWESTPEKAPPYEVIGNIHQNPELLDSGATEQEK